ncbi:MAG: redox-sensing transcriptional repressor Rex [bacterium]|jgi:redox-sensing transcriptional repressor
MRRQKTPDIVIRRLVLYLRVLESIDTTENDNIISSYELSGRAGVSATQLRKDLAMFGEFGKQGVGYNVNRLRAEIRKVLNLNRTYRMGLIGAGGLGVALARYNNRRYQTEESYPFQLIAAFDNDPTKIGREANGVPIYGVTELADRIGELGLQIVIISVPAGAAQDVANTCVTAGIKAILCFAPTKLNLPPDVRVHYSDLGLELRHLVYYI